MVDLMSALRACLGAKGKSAPKAELPAQQGRANANRARAVIQPALFLFFFVVRTFLRRTILRPDRSLDAGAAADGASLILLDRGVRRDVLAARRSGGVSRRAGVLRVGRAAERCHGDYGDPKHSNVHGNHPCFMTTAIIR
ncbi:hypothetical protein [Methylocella sp.]|uniref:hypothetical protein n=1 Tax=Methylocella sp. TaxID=1978226 RepID=UPI0035AE9CFB